MDQLLDNNLILGTKYNITSADTDMESRIRLGALINLLIQSAISSADNLGFGFKGLREQQLFWVLSRLTVEIYKPLMWYNNVQVETWPKNVDGLLYLRDYLVYDKENNCVAKATSGWLAIDLETKRPKLIDGLHADIFVHLKNKHAINELPIKLSHVLEGDVFEIKSGYFDIDLNKHVTSTRYIDWMLDTLSIDFLRTNYPKKISVNFMKETMPGETIRIVRNNANNQFNFEGSNILKNTTSFRGCIDF